MAALPARLPRLDQDESPLDAEARLPSTALSTTETEAGPVLWNNIFDAETGEPLSLRPLRWGGSAREPPSTLGEDCAGTPEAGGEIPLGLKGRRNGKSWQGEDGQGWNNMGDDQERVRKVRTPMKKEFCGRETSAAVQIPTSRNPSPLRGTIAISGDDDGRAEAVRHSSQEIALISVPPAFAVESQGEHPWMPAAPHVRGDALPQHDDTYSLITRGPPDDVPFMARDDLWSGEPRTPRPTDRLHSPFWVPPPQGPPFVAHGAIQNGIHKSRGRVPLKGARSGRAWRSSDEDASGTGAGSGDDNSERSSTNISHPLASQLSPHPHGPGMTSLTLHNDSRKDRRMYHRIGSFNRGKTADGQVRKPRGRPFSRKKEHASFDTEGFSCGLRLNGSAGGMASKKSTRALTDDSRRKTIVQELRDRYLRYESQHSGGRRDGTGDLMDQDRLGRSFRTQRHPCCNDHAYSDDEGQPRQRIISLCIIC